MYYPQAPKEPNGCIQTLVISRVILGILLIPMALIILSVLAVLATFYALSIHPLLGLAVIVGCGLAIFGVAKWEGHRVAKQIPRDD